MKNYRVDSILFIEKAIYSRIITSFKRSINSISSPHSKLKLSKLYSELGEGEKEGVYSRDLFCWREFQQKL